MRQRLLPQNPTILLADDEDLLRQIVQVMLEDEGAKVLTAVDGMDAVEVFEKHPEVNVVVIDFSMPRMNGHDAFLKIREMNPGIGVVMISGLVTTMAVDRLRRDHEIEFLSKPFGVDELCEAINRVVK